MKKSPLSIYSPLQSMRDIANMPLLFLAGMLFLFGASFFNLASLVADKEKVALDIPVLIKLVIVGCAAVYGTYGLYTNRKIWNLVTTTPGVFLTIIVAFYMLAVPVAVSPSNALASTGALAAIVLATVTAAVQLGLLKMLHVMFLAMACFNLGSWYMYFFVPELGVFAEPLPDAENIERMSGMSHPNTLGQYSGMTILVGVILMISYRARGLWMIGIMGSAAVALLACLSRTSILATVIALVVAYRKEVFHPRFHKYYLAVFIAGLIGLTAISMVVDLGPFLESKLGILSKSGDTDELTTATGRAEIWSYTLRKIAERPIMGWGAASSKYVLADYLYYTHNILLNVVFSAGMFAGIAFLAMLVYRFREMWARAHPMDGIFIFILVNGVFENVAFSYIAGMPTIMLCLTVILWKLDGDPALNPGDTGEDKMLEQEDENVEEFGGAVA